nr:MAG: internal scaffolding protein [Microviridae sp.]
MSKFIAPVVHSQFYDSDSVSRETSTINTDRSLAVQSELEESDINTIVRRFGLTGKLPENVRIPQSGDFSGVGSYHDAVNLAMAADEAFMKFPAEVRRRFDHDPANMIAFVEDDRNRDEAIALGLVPAPAASIAPSASEDPSS